MIRAFEQARCPGCLRKPSALAAAFVTEVSTAIHFRIFHIRTAELIGLQQAAAETACELTGGEAYRAVHEAAMDSENEYLHAIASVGHCLQRHERHLQCAAALAASRHQFQSQITAAEQGCARAYWAKQRQNWLQSDPFAHLRGDHPLMQIAAFAPLWWKLFLSCLHTEFSRRDFTQYHLLNELPRLRRQVRPRKVLAALVDEWREANAAILGLPARLHYHVIARRGKDRASEAAAWFNARAPGYTSVSDVAESTRAQLMSHTAALPVHSSDWSDN